MGGAWQGGMHGRVCAWQEGMDGRGGHVWQGCVCGRGHAWWGGHAWHRGVCGRGVCMVELCGRGHAWQEGMCDGGGCAWQKRRSLQRMVRILLECILILVLKSPHNKLSEDETHDEQTNLNLARRT